MTNTTAVPDLPALIAAIEQAAEAWATAEFQHAKNLGAGGPGLLDGAHKAENRFRAALAAIVTQPAPSGDAVEVLREIVALYQEQEVAEGVGPHNTPATTDAFDKVMRRAIAATGRAVHADDNAVDAFAAAMKAKMAASRAKGRSGWNDEQQCTMDVLARMLVEHVSKGDPVDIANFAMMLHQREAAAIEHHPCNGGQASRAIRCATTSRAKPEASAANQQAGEVPRKIIGYNDCRCILTQYCDGKCRPIWSDPCKKAEGAPISDSAAEVKKLAPILFGLCEGGGLGEDINIYADDFQAGDGDVYVYRAAELLLIIAAENRMLGALIKLLETRLPDAAPISEGTKGECDTCEGKAGICRFPMCKSEVEQNAIAAEVHAQLYGAAPAASNGDAEKAGGLCVDSLVEAYSEAWGASFAAENQFDDVLPLTDELRVHIKAGVQAVLAAMEPRRAAMGAVDLVAERADFDAYMKEPCAPESKVERWAMERNGTHRELIWRGWKLRAERDRATASGANGLPDAARAGTGSAGSIGEDVEYQRRLSELLVAENQAYTPAGRKKLAVLCCDFSAYIDRWADTRATKVEAAPGNAGKGEA